MNERARFRYVTRIIRGEKFAAIRVPKKIVDEIEDGSEITVTIEKNVIEEKQFNDNITDDDATILKKIDLEKKIYNWFLTQSTSNEDGKMSVSPRTVANNFDIKIEQAHVILALMETEEMIKEDKDHPGLYTIKEKRQ